LPQKSSIQFRHGREVGDLARAFLLLMGAEYDQLHQKEIAHGRARYRGKPAVSHDGVSLRSSFILYSEAEATPVNRGAAHRPDVMCGHILVQDCPGSAVWLRRAIAVRC
jgi:hypothetical protein